MCRRLAWLLVVVLALPVGADAAAPPDRARNLTAEEEKEVAAFLARLDKHGHAGEFEQAAKVARQVADYRSARQGARHWQAIGARLGAEQWKRLAAVAVKDRAEVLRAMSLNGQGLALVNQGRPREAEKHLRNALGISEKVLGEGHPDTAICYGNLAYCLRELGRPSEALPLYRKGLGISEKALGGGHPDTATGYNNLASCLDALGKSSEALPLLRKALGIRREALGEGHPDTANSYSNVASCLDALGKPSEALPPHRKALGIRQRALGEGHPHTASSYNNLAVCLDKLGRPSESLPLHRKAMGVFREALGEGHPHTANSSSNLASCLASMGEMSLAARLLQHSLAGQEVARFHMARESGFDRAVALSGKLSARDGLAALLAGLKQPRNAFAHAEASLARGLLDDLGSSGNPDVARLRGLQARLARLDSALVASAGLGAPTEGQRARHDALAREQRAVASELARLVAEDSARRVLPLWRIQQNIPVDSALVLWVESIGRWACVVRRAGPPAWVALRGSGEGGALTKDDNTLPDRLHRALTDPGTAESHRRQLSDAFVRQLFDPLRPRLKGVRRLFVVPSGPLARVPLDALVGDFAVCYAPSGTLLALTMERHRAVDGSSLLAVGDPTFDRAPPPEPPASGVLLRSGLPGGHAARAGLQPGDVLLSVGAVAIDSFADVDAALKEVPAAVAYWRDGRRLEGRLQGAPLGAALDERSARAAVRAWRREREAVAQRGTGHKRLPATRTEVEALAAMVKGSTALLGSDASEQRLDELIDQGKLKGFRLVHIATHGETDELAPSRSAVILAQDRLPDPLAQLGAGRHPYDGRLTVSRIRERWGLDADLVVLSACETGLGKEAKGDGLLGFAQAFLSRGARSVVLSRWKVDDGATALLMVRFYENLLGKREGAKPMGRAQALAEAKRWLRELPRKEAERLAALHSGGVLRGSEGDQKPPGKAKAVELKGDRPFAHPHYWAAWTLLGDPD